MFSKNREKLPQQNHPFGLLGLAGQALEELRKPFRTPAPTLDNSNKDKVKVDFLLQELANHNIILPNLRQVILFNETVESTFKNNGMDVIIYHLSYLDKQGVKRDYTIISTTVHKALHTRAQQVQTIPFTTWEVFEDFSSQPLV